MEQKKGGNAIKYFSSQKYINSILHSLLTDEMTDKEQKCVIIDTDKPCYEIPTQSKPTRARNVMK